MKKLKSILAIGIILLCFFIVAKGASDVAYADEKSTEQQLEDSTDSQLDKLDFSSLENILNKLTKEQKDIFGQASFIEKVQSLIAGKFDNTYNSFFSYLMSIIFDDLLSFIPTLAMIIAIAIICSFVGQISSPKAKSIANVIYFVCFGVVVVLIFSATTELLALTQDVLSSIQTQMEIVFPILLTLITAVGGVVTVSAFQPAIAFLSVGIMKIFTSIIMPLFIFSLAFNVVGNLSNNMKLDKFSKFTSSFYKWIIGITFTVFIAFLTIQGITASAVDGISIKTARFALKSYVPILGGYLSDGFNLIVASSVLIKNAVGAGALMLLIATVIVPIIKIVVFMFGLKIVAAIIQPLCDNRMSEFIYGVSKCLTMLVVCIVGVGFMYLITVGLLMCMANVV